MRNINYKLKNIFLPFYFIVIFIIAAIVPNISAQKCQEIQKTKHEKQDTEKLTNLAWNATFERIKSLVKREKILSAGN